MPSPPILPPTPPGVPAKEWATLVNWLKSLPPVAARATQKLLPMAPGGAQLAPLGLRGMAGLTPQGLAWMLGTSGLMEGAGWLGRLAGHFASPEPEGNTAWGFSVRPMLTGNGKTETSRPMVFRRDAYLSPYDSKMPLPVGQFSNAHTYGPGMSDLDRWAMLHRLQHRANWEHRNDPVPQNNWDRLPLWMDRHLPPSYPRFATDNFNFPDSTDSYRFRDYDGEMTNPVRETRGGFGNERDFLPSRRPDPYNFYTASGGLPTERILRSAEELTHTNGGWFARVPIHRASMNPRGQYLPDTQVPPDYDDAPLFEKAMNVLYPDPSEAEWYKRQRLHQILSQRNR